MGLFRWLSGIFGGRKGKLQQESRGQRVRLLRFVVQIACAFLSIITVD